MPKFKVVLDTNALLRSISRKSRYAIVLDKLYEAKYELFITTEILLEYEEMITKIFSKETAELIISAISYLPNVIKIETYFQLGLISTDEDDNKFSDCAFAGNVHFLVTDDKHFNVLRSVAFPSINVIKLEDFKNLMIK